MKFILILISLASPAFSGDFSEIDVNSRVYRSLFPTDRHSLNCPRLTAHFAHGTYSHGPKQIQRLKEMTRHQKHFKTLLTQYPDAFQKAVLEIGPLYQPLIPLREYFISPFFWDMDLDALLRLQEENFLVTAQYIDFNHTTAEFLEDFRKRTRHELKNKILLSFNAVVISQVINYVDDYRAMLALVSEFQMHGDYLFIDNPLGGHPGLLSDHRPTHNELIRTVESLGYQVEATFFEEDKVKRVHLVGRKQ